MAKKKEKEEALETKKSSAMAVYDYGEDAGAGFEHQTKADTSIPFIVLLQSLSPIVVEEKAKSGQFFNTVTEELWPRDEGLLFVPATTRHFFAEWIPRDEGGGFCGHHEINSPEVKKAIANVAQYGRNKTEDGHDLVETFYVYGVICSEDGDPVSMAVMAFKSTKIRSYKTWMTRLRDFKGRTEDGRIIRPPLFAHLTRIKSVLKKNEHGQFYVPSISAAVDGDIEESLLGQEDPRFQMARACRELVDSGDAKVDPGQQEAHGGSENAPF